MPASMLPKPLRLAVLLSAVLVTACTPASDKPDAGVTVSSLPCSIDAECADLGFVCDEQRRTCVCTRDAMCTGKQGTPYCNAFTGQCVADIAGCKSDSECESGEFCDQSIRTCRAKKAYCGTCTQDEECGGDSDHCVKHPDFPGSPAACATACSANEVCPAGQTCRNTEKGKQCLPSIGRCQGGQGSVCNPDSGQSCQNDRMCSEGSEQICDLGSGRCMAANSGCQSGQSCDPISRSCVTACRGDLECQERYGSTEFLCVRSACVPAELCSDDGECAPGKFCFRGPGVPDEEKGLCQDSCTTDSECPLGERCQTNPLSGRNRCMPGCVDNSYCPLNSICTGGQCEFTTSSGAKRCQVKEVCDFRENCDSNICVPKSGHCTSCAAGCDTGRCEPMFFNAQCGSGSTLTCPAGSTKSCNLNFGSCFGCACKIDRCAQTCNSDSQCPNGFYCIGTCFPIDASLCR